MADLQKIVDELSGLTVLEAADLARQIGEAAHRVTDAQVSSVLMATGSEKATFEIIMAAALGAGLPRWQQAMKVLDEATDAPA